MWNDYSQLDGNEIVGIVAILSVFGSAVLVVFIIALAATFRSVRVAKIQSQLVSKLVDRGFAPHEITNILLATGVQDPKKAVELMLANQNPTFNGSVPPQKPIVQQSVPR